MRYRGDKQVKVLKDSECIEEFATRPNAAYWKTIEVVQTATKSKTGCGAPIFVHFFAPLDEDAPSEEIVYDHASYPSDAELIKAGDYQGYALK